jgi:hypothetical protein
VPEGKAIMVDLTSKGGQALVWRLLTLRKIVFVMMEPPCGTASRARGIPTVESSNPNLSDPTPAQKGFQVYAMQTSSSRDC